MDTSLTKFFRTGQLGPLTLGMSPADVEVELGRPQMRSRKFNPLITKYGPLELTFWAPRSQPPQLKQVRLSFIEDPQGLPPALRFDDWKAFETMNIRGFERFLEQIRVRPEEVLRSDHESSIVFPSGLVASFWEGQLRTLVLSKRERDENRVPTLTDELEPTIEDIQLQIEKARNALSHGLDSAAILLAWGAIEAVLRRNALRAGFKGKVRVQPTILIRELYALGRLTREEVEVLESARQQRTTIAHGLPSASIDRDDVLQIIRLAEHLLTR
jgi:hypothetical protein